MMTAGLAAPAPRVSVVVPVNNERGNVGPLISEIEAAFAGFGAYEMIFVDDASDDGTGEILLGLMAAKPLLRLITHDVRSGKSRATLSAIRLARAPVIAMLDGDGQSDPSFLPPMIERLEAAGEATALIQGERQRRQDTMFKKIQSRLANHIRRAILNDKTRDTGCAIKVIRRDIYLQLPFFAGQHRFFPALVNREGYAILIHPVKDRPRLSGQSHYGFFNRFWVGIMDLIGVWWLIRRQGLLPKVTEAAR